MGGWFWFGFLGGWLLFAGPIYQAAIELRDPGITRDEAEEMRERVGSIPAPKPVSRWWWLLPPVAYVLSMRRRRQWRTAALGAMNMDDWRLMQSYKNKATGWLIVALGALCIAYKETGELVEHQGWNGWTMAALIVVPFILSVGYTVSSLGREHQLEATVAASHGVGDAP
ncbi:MAG: hypothetical protein QM728_09605 [Gordonia sp. (in: high G+C Gram-positive bacteria)]|uniref:hypothetical protein n=1 Tax=Gordonia sp. (in: high G+C Gram-positive bacteria) TaxID=84139 RepID=UPI0039E35244